MATVVLKTGETVQVSIEELEDYLRQNADKIQPQKLKRRGSLRRKLFTRNNSAA